MKKLTETQKKWALTTALTGALSLNMLFSLTTFSGYSSASLASSEPRIESVKSYGQELRVKYVPGAGENTLAIIGEEESEGSYCYEKCSTRQYLLPKNFSSNASDLESALHAAIHRNETAQAEKPASSKEGQDLDAKPAEAAKPKEEKQTQAKNTDNDDQDDKENPDFAALRERCKKKSDDAAELRCFATGLTKLLKNKNKTYDRNEVMSLFREEIEPGLRAGLADISDLIPRRSGGRFSMGLDVEMEGSSRREEAQSLVEEMLGQIDRKYNFLRQRLTALTTKAVLNNQESAQAKLKQAEQIKSADPQTALRLQMEGYARLRASNQVANELGGTLYSGLESAQWSNFITNDQFDTMYYTNYADVVNQAIRGMAANPLTYSLPSVTLADGQVIVDANGTSFTVTPTANPVVQNRVNGRNISVMTNGLTAANAANSSTPRILSVSGVAQPGTASIQLFQGTAAPVNQTNSVVPATVRLRGQ